ncbi:MAG: NAD-dependent epimerase/dehydratase family protein [Candidatus Eisenbacteria bacterium]|nr:NAD-dependent epimerase/dehydratase family protein [Candidatus Eisenbacteria bacterium]
MRVFLTGATGYLGGRLLKALLAAEHQIRVLVRRPERLDPELRERLEIIQGDLGARPEAKFLEGIEALIHSGAMVRTWHRRRWMFDQVNVEGYRSLLEAAREAGVAKVVHTSSFMALGPSGREGPLTEESPRWGGPPMNDYERTKWAAERVSRRFVEDGGPLVSLYPAVIYGPGRRTDGNLVGKLAYLLREGKFPGLLGSGQQRWTLAFVDDVVAGHMAALEKGEPGGRFILGGPTVVLRDLVERLSSLLGRPSRVRTLPIAAGKLVGAAQVLRAYLGGPVPELTPGVAEVYRHNWVFASGRAETELGYTITPLDDGLRRTAEWVKGLPGWD